MNSSRRNRGSPFHSRTSRARRAKIAAFARKAAIRYRRDRRSDTLPLWRRKPPILHQHLDWRRNTISRSLPTRIQADRPADNFLLPKFGLFHLTYRLTPVIQCVPRLLILLIRNEQSANSLREFFAITLDQLERERRQSFTHSASLLLDRATFCLSALPDRPRRAASFFRFSIFSAPPNR